MAKTRKSQDFTVGLKHSSSLREGQPGESLETRINQLTSQSESSDNKSGLAAVIMQLASSNTKFSSTSGGGSNENQATTVSAGVGDKGASNGHQHRKHGKTKSLSEKTSSLLDRTTNLMEKGEGPSLSATGGTAGGPGSGGIENIEWQGDRQHRGHHKSKSHHHHHHHHRHHSKHHHHRHHGENKWVTLKQ